MAIEFRRTASQRLSRTGLVVAPRRAGRGWLDSAVLALALGSGAVGGWLWRESRIAPPPAPAASPAEVRTQLEQIEQGGLALRLSQARGRELERQIDVLNQQLAESQEQLAFFRKAREGKR
ncbi:MAG: hypothetical protein ABI326_00455 [Caldimonas sp.]